jgi:hypothetical protein
MSFSPSLDNVAYDLAKEIAAILKKKAIINDEPSDGYIMQQVGYFIAENEGMNFALTAFLEPMSGIVKYEDETKKAGR